MQIYHGVLIFVNFMIDSAVMKLLPTKLMYPDYVQIPVVDMVDRMHDRLSTIIL